jgi:NhaP-type Na+/H+ and K+/H+ antiporter
MHGANELILVGGALGMVAIFAGLISRRIGAPLLLVFLALGMLEGEDGPGGIIFDDFRFAYLIGSIALAVILFEGGLKTGLPTFRRALVPALLLATVGVAATAGIVGAAAHWLGGVPLAPALLLGAAVAPTDAAAVASLLRSARLAVPERVLALLEVESGLNDPMSIFLTLVLMGVLRASTPLSAGHAALMFLEEMAGGAAFGLAGGWLLRGMFRRLRLDGTLAPILGLTGCFTLFGAAQVAGTSGFLAIYLAGVVAATGRHATRDAIEHFFEAMAWLSQIVLFLMLGLLVTPHELVPLIPRAIGVALVLIFIARPAAVFACLAPLGFHPRESAFASWVGLRGAVPIYLTIVPVLADPARGGVLFGVVFVIVIASLVIQGWSIPLVGRLLGYARTAEGGATAPREAESPG